MGIQNKSNKANTLKWNILILKKQNIHTKNKINLDNRAILIISTRNNIFKIGYLAYQLIGFICYINNHLIISVKKHIGKYLIVFNFTILYRKIKQNIFYVHIWINFKVITLDMIWKIIHFLINLCTSELENQQTKDIHYI